MISAPNHLRQLSGSKSLFPLILLVLMIFGCTSTKTIIQQKIPQDKVVIDKPKEPKSNKIDTVEWIEVSEDSAPPIINETPAAPGLDKKNSYTVSLLMPMNANKLNATDGPNPDLDDNKFVNFYAGAMLALEDLESNGANLDVHVYDTKNTSTSSLMGGYELRSSDVIVGPRDTEELKSIANFGKEREISVVSPWKSSSKIASENPYYIQLIPGLYDHYYKIAEHAAENFDSEHVVLLGRNNTDKRRFKYFTQDVEFEEYMIEEDSLLMGETAFDSLLFDPVNPTAFIIPNYSSKDERYVYNCLRKLNIEKGMKDIVVYGMPLMKDSDRTTYNLYKSLNMHVCMSKFVDKEDSAVINFERTYYERYAALPTTDAFEGYDVMMFIGKNLMKYGRNFQFHIEKNKDDYLQTSFDLERTFKSEDLDKDNFENVNFYANKHLDIVAFKQKSFKRLRE